ncbi:hypothetical protein F5X96DRAFT_650311 [Biscogniauxia mediterranea]|nr:hypothetical protein F5X96DRAFT_650311 [Biscogniauxia mediterranea]
MPLLPSVFPRVKSNLLHCTFSLHFLCLLIFSNFTYIDTHYSLAPYPSLFPFFFLCFACFKVRHQ